MFVVKNADLSPLRRRYLAAVWTLFAAQALMTAGALALKARL